MTLAAVLDSALLGALRAEGDVLDLASLPDDLLVQVTDGQLDLEQARALVVERAQAGGAELSPELRWLLTAPTPMKGGAG